MTTIRNFLRMGWLAQAAYAAFPQSSWGTSTAAAVQLRVALQRNPENRPVLAEGQSASLVDGGFGSPAIAVLHHQPNTASGMSATLFRDANGGYVLAARGTEPTLGQTFEDILGADAFGIAISGVARGQLVDLYRYYRRLTSPPGQVQYSASELVMLSMIPSGGNIPDAASALVSLTLETTTDLGLDAIPAGTPISMTGHSLGGHLVFLLNSILPSGAVGDVYTFNAPGLGGIGAQLAEWRGLSGPVPSANVHNIIAEAGWDVVARFGLIAGSEHEAFIEGAWTAANPDNHSMYRLSDALAIVDLLVQIDPGLTLDRANHLLGIASPIAGETLERTLDSLRRLFVGSGSPTTVDQGTDAQVEAGRNSLYENVSVLQAVIAGLPGYSQSANSLGLQIVALNDFSESELAQRFRSDVAFRFALVNRVPFAVVATSPRLE